MNRDSSIAELLSPSDGKVDLLIIAGEHSGDELAAHMVQNLLEENPHLKIAALGGDRLKESGVELVYNMVDHSVMGLVDVIKNYSFLKSLFDNTLSWIKEHQPRHICFVDYPGFNLRLARALKELRLSQKGGGEIGLHYYVSPQIWAWKSKRRFKMAKTLDSLGVLFPFEKECYSDTDLPVTYLGHPFAEKNYPLPVEYDPDGKILLLPGSRIKSIEMIAPIIFEAFQRISAKDSSLSAVILYPSHKVQISLEAILKSYPTLTDKVSLVKNDSTKLKVKGAIMSSGTISLSMALASVPGVIIYKLSQLNYWLLRTLVKVRFIGLANLILDQSIYPELLQKRAKVENIVNELTPYLNKQESIDDFMDASNLLRYKLIDDREMSASEWVLDKISN
ncbi:MAG: Lipid-A-disaccharide synthase [Puniceicoccaceae bacterium MED-G32]|jgi:lipid-A-disaccharide synthase|nr:MAG: Lipid-A-disaccharide synthase [Puniceicoccaceae bacterium MED-G32]